MSYSNYLGELQNVGSTKPVVSTTKGTDIMGKMLLSQYSNSDLFKSYLLAFVEEMDILFEQVEEVYLGRFIEFAVGEQLDVIGVILNQARAVSLPKTYFGFQGAVSPEKMSDEAAPSDGGYFKGEEEENFQITPLDDATYRRLLLAKAYANRLESCSVNETYLLSRILLGEVPRKLQIVTNTSTSQSPMQNVYVMAGNDVDRYASIPTFSPVAFTTKQWVRIDDLLVLPRLWGNISSGNKSRLAINTSGGVVLTDSSGTTLATSSGDIIEGQDHYLETEVLSDGSCEIWVDGVSQASGVAGTFNGLAWDIDSIDRSGGSYSSGIIINQVFQDLAESLPRTYNNTDNYVSGGSVILPDSTGGADGVWVNAVMSDRVYLPAQDGIIAKQNIELHLSVEDTTNSQSALLYYFRKYMVPLGTTFNIIRS
tara:strand:+ start:14808 stop:16082 length:1275 start_codon:yes stop_codon:yes gene_type:complete